MLDYNERIRRRVYLFIAVILVIFAAYRIYQHDRHKIKASKEMKQGVKVLTDPESVVKDLE
jgi:hypothetical protein